MSFDQCVFDELEQCCLGSLTISSVCSDNWYVWSEVEPFADLLHAVMELTMKGVDRHYERDLGSFEVLNRSEGVLETASIKQYDCSDRPTRQLVPHEAETILTWGSKEIQHEFFTEANPSEVHGDRC